LAGCLVVGLRVDRPSHRALTQRTAPHFATIAPFRSIGFNTETGALRIPVTWDESARTHNLLPISLSCQAKIFGFLHVRQAHRRSRRNLRARAEDRDEGTTVEELATKALKRDLARAWLKTVEREGQLRRGNMTDEEVEAVVERAVQESRGRS